MFGGGNTPSYALAETETLFLESSVTPGDHSLGFLTHRSTIAVPTYLRVPSKHRRDNGERILGWLLVPLRNEPSRSRGPAQQGPKNDIPVACASALQQANQTPSSGCGFRSPVTPVPLPSSAHPRACFLALPAWNWTPWAIITSPGPQGGRGVSACLRPGQPRPW